jgi:SAM-dependent methyltransferase
VHEILRALAPGSKVLDLGSGRGSFDDTAYALKVFRADAETPAEAHRNFVACSADALPFPDGCFHAVISNHSFEHFENLDGCVKELARVLAAGALIYIAVPDASTFTDRVYRWLVHGGGHVNAFSDVHALPRIITAATGRPLAQTRVLCSSLVYLNRRSWGSRPPRKLILFANGRESFLRSFVFLLRTMDRWVGTRASVYGWAYFFGELAGIDAAVASNVCMRCGAAHATGFLGYLGLIHRRRILPSTYACPSCEAFNYFIDDRYFAGLQ